MRLGIRTAISALVLTSIVVSAVGVHLLWWRTAHQVSQTLANTINDQIVSAVGMLREVEDGWPSAVSTDLNAEHMALTEDEIRERMSGNLCRCAAYANIVPAIAEVAR